MFDTKCLDLAQIFIGDEPTISQDRAGALAQTIQDAIEDWLQENRTSDHPRFAQVKCSQCGQVFGPANYGYSHCQDHAGIPARGL